MSPMFQSFDVTSTSRFGRERADALRATFDGLGASSAPTLVDFY